MGQSHMPQMIPAHSCYRHYVTSNAGVGIAGRVIQEPGAAGAGASPLVAITMGDPAGIGPEIAVKALADERVRRGCRPLLVGSAEVFAEAARIVGSGARVVPVADPGAACWGPEYVNVVESEAAPAAELRRGEVSPAAGAAGYRAIARAVELARTGEVAATVTGPIHKEALNLAGFRFAGQTEIFAHLTGTRDYAMLLMAGSLRVVHVSTHVSLREACERATRQRVETVIRLAHEAGRRLGIARPRIGVAGLNPHASDGGLFGSEERDEIIPAIAAARAAGMVVEGPLPADTLFPKANGGYFDLVVAMYHDQGHIPLKVVGFTWDNGAGAWSSVDGVNVTLGIPVIRVSVDHGTAFDVAGTGQASEASMIHAILCAAQMAAAN